MKQMLHELRFAIRAGRGGPLRRGLQGDGADQPDPGGDDLVVGRALDPDARRLSQVPRRARHLVGLPVRAVPRDRIPPRAQGPELPRPLCRRQRGAGARCSRRSTSRACAKRRIGALERAGFDLGDRSVEAIAAAWLQVYRDADRWFELYELAEKLVDIDDALAMWRHKHVLTVERIIGNKRGHRRLGRRALSALDARQARVPRAVVAEDRSLSFKRLFSPKPLAPIPSGCISPRTAITCGPTPASMGRSRRGTTPRGSPTASGTR